MVDANLLENAIKTYTRVCANIESAKRVLTMVATISKSIPRVLPELQLIQTQHYCAQKDAPEEIKMWFQSTDDRIYVVSVKERPF